MIQQRRASQSFNRASAREGVATLRPLRPRRTWDNPAQSRGIPAMSHRHCQIVRSSPTEPANENVRRRLGAAGVFKLGWVRE